MRRIIPSIVLIWLILAFFAPVASAAPAYVIDMGSGESVDALAFNGDKLYVAYESPVATGTKYAVSTRGYYGNHIHYFESYSSVFRESDGKQSRLKPNCLYMENDFIYAWCWRPYSDGGTQRADRVLVVYSETGSVMSEYILDSSVDTTAPLIEPKTMACDGTYLYLPDPSSGLVLKVTKDGTPVTKFSTVSSGLTHPDAVAISGNMLLVSDSASGKTLSVTKDFKNATAYPFGASSIAAYGGKYASVEGGRLVLRNASMGVIRIIDPAAFGPYVPVTVEVYGNKVAVLARSSDVSRPDGIFVYDAPLFYIGEITPPDFTPTPSIKPTPTASPDISPTSVPTFYCCPGPIGLILTILSLITGLFT